MEHMDTTHTDGAPAPAHSGWRSVGLALLFLAAYFVVQLLVTVSYVFATAMHTLLTESVPSMTALIASVVETVTMQSERLTGVIDLLSLGAFALILRLMRRPILASVGIRRVSALRLIPLVPLGVALNVLFTSLISMLPPSVLMSYMEAASPVLMGESGVLSVLIIVVLAPLTEETLFRGLIYGSLKRALPRALAVALSAVVFGLMHGQILWVAYTAVLGAFFCIICDRYGSLLSCILLHMSFNAGSFLVLQLENTPLGLAIAVSGTVAAACIALIFYKPVAGQSL